MPISPYFRQLQPASWRGVPFNIAPTEGAFGRRQAPHEYFGREQGYVEDTGRKLRRFNVAGRLIGDDVITQRGRMIFACETKGPGTLVHPTYGRMTVSLADVSFHDSERGRVFEIYFTFLESGAAIFPNTSAATQNIVAASGLAAIAAAVGGFLTTLQLALSSGAGVVHQIIGTVTSWSTRISGIAQDATSLFSMIGNLPNSITGILGRYFGGATIGFANVGAPAASINPALPAPTTQAQVTAALTTLTAQASMARAAVASAVSTLNAAAAAGNPQSIADAVQALLQALLEAMANPADALRLLIELYNYPEAAVLGSSPIAQAMLSAQNGLLTLFRRAVLQVLAQASAAYQPASAQDAANVRTQVCCLIEAEITIAGDAGDDANYQALRALLAAVAQDLAARGTALPEMIAVNSPAPVPSLVLAQRLYRDSSRAAQLVTFADTPHPAFMPTSFQALAS